MEEERLQETTMEHHAAGYHTGLVYLEIEAMRVKEGGDFGLDRIAVLTRKDVTRRISCPPPYLHDRSAVCPGLIFSV